MKPIIIKDSRMVSKSNFKIMGLAVLVMFIGIASWIVFSSYYVLAIGVGIFVLLNGRKVYLKVDPEKREIIRKQLIWNLPIIGSKKVFYHTEIAAVNIKSLSESGTITPVEGNVPTRYKIDEYYVELKLHGKKEALRIRILNTYKETLHLAEELAEAFNVTIKDYIKLRAEKAKKKKLELQKRGLR